ncbi:MAG: hypothetical protein WBA10_18880 [Elainellaceae cyanobacterium]
MADQNKATWKEALAPAIAGRWLMLFDPERKTQIDTDERVLTSDPRRAAKLCEDIAEQERKRGEVIELKGVRPSKSGKTHNCIFEREIQE